LLAVYWLLLMIGTHVPSAAIGSPLIWDKLVHWAAYTGLGVLLMVVVQSRCGLNLRRYAVVFLIAGGYGAIDELAQLPIPGRNADLHDWFADLLGVASGLIIYRLVSTLTVSGPTRREAGKTLPALPITNGRAAGSDCPAPHRPLRHSARRGAGAPK
jgi:VanZ family protein